MSIFIAYICIVLFHFALIFAQTLQPNNNWYTWIVLSKFAEVFYFYQSIVLIRVESTFFSFLVWIGVAFAVITGVLGVICMRNFDKGLKPFVQRGSVKAKMDIESNISKAKAHESWQIDDD